MRYGSDERVDGREAVGNSLGRAPVGRRRYGSATTRWMEGKPWEIAWGDFRWEGTDGSNDIGGRRGKSSGGKERCGSDDRVDREETVGNSLGRVPVKRSDTGVTTRWMEGKAWEIACGYSVGERPPWEIAWGDSSVGKEQRWKRRDGGRRGKPWEIDGNSMGRAPWGRSDTEATIGWTDGKR